MQQDELAVMKRVAMSVFAFTFGGRTRLSSVRGMAYLRGLNHGLQAAGYGNIGAPLEDWADMKNDELAMTMSAWYGHKFVTSTDLP